MSAPRRTFSRVDVRPMQLCSVSDRLTFLWRHRSTGWWKFLKSDINAQRPRRTRTPAPGSLCQRSFASLWWITWRLLSTKMSSGEVDTPTHPHTHTPLLLLLFQQLVMVLILVLNVGDNRWHLLRIASFRIRHPPRSLFLWCAFNAFQNCILSWFR